MMIKDILSHTPGKVVDLYFRDGHAVRARVVSVDLAAPAEIIYDILEVLSPGPAKYAGVRVGIVAAAAVEDVSRAVVMDAIS